MSVTRETNEAQGAHSSEGPGCRGPGTPRPGRRPRGAETGAQVWMLEQIRRCVSGRKEARASGTSPPRVPSGERGCRTERGIAADSDFHYSMIVYGRLDSSFFSCLDFPNFGQGGRGQ